MSLKHICDNCDKRADSTYGWAEIKVRSTYDLRGNVIRPEKNLDICDSCWAQVTFPVYGSKGKY